MSNNDKNYDKLLKEFNDLKKSIDETNEKDFIFLKELFDNLTKWNENQDIVAKEYAFKMVDDWIDELMCKKVLVKSQEEAIRILDENGINYRVVRGDSNHYAITDDYRPERLNLEIDNDIVTQVYSG